MIKTFVLSAAAIAMAAVIAAPAYAQLCDDELGCEDGGQGGGLGGGTAPGKGTGTPTPTPVASPTTTITFNNVGATLGNFSEGSYNFQTTSGTFQGGYGAYGSRGIGVLGPLAAAYNPSAPANTFVLTRADGGLFTINSFFSVIAGPAGTNTVAIQGYLNGSLLGSSTVRQTDVFGFGFPQSSGLAQAFDQAIFTLSTTSSSSSFDNLSLTAVAGVPEPASWALMVLGIGAIGYAARRRQRIAVTYA